MADNDRRSEPFPAKASQIDEPNPPEIVTVHSRRIACDGVGGSLGHPRVWLEMGEANFVECGYCDRRFVIGGSERMESEFAAPGVYEGPGGH